ncbi:MAG: PD40 domain-containing protein, partial [Ignavibacteriales bacterium]|nr:PD40 domain-containing protein [Ignavibacteriales bacterium]
PDGKAMYFVSDRGKNIEPTKLSAPVRMFKHDYHQRDLYRVEVATGNIQRITDYPNSDETSPVPSPDGKKLLYISDRNGINNVYVRELESGLDLPITNSLSGVYQLSVTRDGSKLVFSSLNEAGFDIYLMLRPFERRLNVTSLEPTEFFKKRFALPRDEKPKEIARTVPSSDTVGVRQNVVVVVDSGEVDLKYKSPGKVDLRNYIFTPEAIRMDTTNVPPIASRFEVQGNQDNEGNYIPKKYKLTFSPDLVYGAANYSTFYGLQGTTVMAFSDLMGDHQIVFQTNLLLDLKNSDYGLSYLYLPGRIDWGFQGFHSARFLYLGTYADTLYRFRTWGLGLMAQYPIDRFNRLDLSAMWLNLSRENMEDSFVPAQRRSFILPTLSYVNDNTLWQGGWFAPNNGSRFNLTLYGTPKVNKDALELLTATADYRSYSKWMKELIFAFRLTGGISNGADRQFFFIGGTDGWINRRFESNQIPIVNVEDYAFLTPVLPLRGFNYNVQNGTRFALANLELRFPLVRYLIFGALPLGFANILGAAFVDVGSAWSNTQAWRAFGSDPNGATVLRDLLVGTGVGTRLFFFGRPLRIDVAWNFNWQGFSTPMYYFSLGPEF